MVYLKGQRLIKFIALHQVLKESVKSCVIDAEAVAWDTEKQQILPFQVLSHRKRKVSIIYYAADVQCIHA